MSRITNQRPALNPEMERCIATAKSLAIAESPHPKVDSLHLIIAAIRTVPHPAQAALEKAGYSWQAAQGSCPQIEAKIPEEVAQRPLPLVDRLRQVIYGEIILSRKTNDKVTMSTERCLGLILKNPSIRLKDFLRRITGLQGGKIKQIGSGGVEPYRSFREYLAAKREVWHLRRLAFGEVQILSDEYSGRGQKRLSESARERLLNKLARVEEQTAHRATVSPEEAVPLRRIAEEYQLSSLQTDLIEGVTIYELYGMLEFLGEVVSVRELAQMMAPETYPGNCWQVVEGIAGLVERGILQASDPPDACPTLSSRVRLGSDIRTEILTRLAKDIINDADLKAARRRLSVSNFWPL